MMELLHKPIRFMCTQSWDEKYSGFEGAMYIKIALEVLIKYPVDMLVFEYIEETGKMQVKLAGYNFVTEKLDETTIAYETKLLKIDRFWLKINDYGKEFIGTFLFPSEY